MLEYDMSMAAARPSDLKLNNRMQILEMFKTGGDHSVSDLSRDIGISRQTVMKAIQFFLEKGIIVSDGKADSGSMGGKRAELFTLAADKYLFNVLVCPNCLYVSLFNYRCEVLEDRTEKDIAALGVNDIMARAVRICEDMMGRHGIRMEDVRGVCLTSSGIMERATNRMRYNSLFPNWGKEVPIAERLYDFFNIDTVILTENVARVCGSAWLHRYRGTRTRALSVFSRWGGVAANVMHGGRILYGKDALIGEIGHMIVNPCDDEVCACGSRGCFERQVSVERLRSLAERWQGDHPGSVLLEKSLDQMNLQDVFAASAQGDSLGRALSGRAAKVFAAALRNVSLMFDPEEVIFQGDYAFADDYFAEVMFRELRDFHYYDGAPFRLECDRRSIRELTTQGAYTLLIDRLFNEEVTNS